jgi:hypothetical protein
MQDSYGNYQANMGSLPADLAPTTASKGSSGSGAPTSDATSLGLGSHYWDYTNKVDYVVDLVNGVNTWIQFV